MRPAMPYASRAHPADAGRERDAAPAAAAPVEEVPPAVAVAEAAASSALDGAADADPPQPDDPSQTQRDDAASLCGWIEEAVADVALTTAADALFLPLPLSLLTPSLAGWAVRAAPGLTSAAAATAVWAAGPLLRLDRAERTLPPLKAADSAATTEDATAVPEEKQQQLAASAAALAGAAARRTGTVVQSALLDALLDASLDALPLTAALATLRFSLLPVCGLLWAPRLLRYVRVPLPGDAHRHGMLTAAAYLVDFLALADILDAMQLGGGGGGGWEDWWGSWTTGGVASGLLAAPEGSAHKNAQTSPHPAYPHTAFAARCEAAWGGSVDVSSGGRRPPQRLVTALAVLRFLVSLRSARLAVARLGRLLYARAGGFPGQLRTYGEDVIVACLYLATPLLPARRRRRAREEAGGGGGGGGGWCGPLCTGGGASRAGPLRLDAARAALAEQRGPGGGGSAWRRASLWLGGDGGGADDPVPAAAALDGNDEEPLSAELGSDGGADGDCVPPVARGRLLTRWRRAPLRRADGLSPSPEPVGRQRAGPFKQQAEDPGRGAAASTSVGSAGGGEGPHGPLLLAYGGGGSQQQDAFLEWLVARELRHLALNGNGSPSPSSSPAAAVDRRRCGGGQHAVACTGHEEEDLAVVPAEAPALVVGGAPAAWRPPRQHGAEKPQPPLSWQRVAVNYSEEEGGAECAISGATLGAWAQHQRRQNQEVPSSSSGAQGAAATAEAAVQPEQFAAVGPDAPADAAAAAAEAAAAAAELAAAEAALTNAFTNIIAGAAALLPLPPLPPEEAGARARRPPPWQRLIPRRLRLFVGAARSAAQRLYVFARIFLAIQVVLALAFLFLVVIELSPAFVDILLAGVHVLRGGTTIGACVEVVRRLAWPPLRPLRRWLLFIPPVPPDGGDAGDWEEGRAAGGQGAAPRIPADATLITTTGHAYRAGALKAWVLGSAAASGGGDGVGQGMLLGGNGGGGRVQAAVVHFLNTAGRRPVLWNEADVAAMAGWEAEIIRVHAGRLRGAGGSGASRDVLTYLPFSREALQLLRRVEDDPPTGGRRGGTAFQPQEEQPQEEQQEPEAAARGGGGG